MREAGRTLLLVAPASNLVTTARSNAQDRHSKSLHAVFVMTTRNEAMSFQREADGSLREGHTFANDGRRTGGVVE